MALITFDWENSHYELDIDTINAAEYKVIKTHTGLKMGAIIKSFSDLEDFDADALVALLWVCRSRAGNSAWPSDDIRPTDLLNALAMTADAEVAEAQKPVRKPRRHPLPSPVR